MSTYKFDLCPKTYTFFYNEYERTFEKQYLIIEGYYTYLHSLTKEKFLHELMLKWILDLPEQYPDTKFIFLPNTEMSREIALRYFKKGILFLRY